MSPMPDQRSMLCYESGGATQTRSHWTWRGEMGFAIVVAVMALLVILPFFDTPPGHPFERSSPSGSSSMSFPDNFFGRFIAAHLFE